MRQVPRILPQMNVVIVQHEAIDVYFGTPFGDASLEKVHREAVGSMQSNSNAASYAFANLLEPKKRSTKESATER